MTTSSLDLPCACGRRIGDHTLDEWDVCGATPEQPYEPLPPDSALLGSVGLGDYTIADNLVARASVLHVGAANGVELGVAVVLLDFAIGHPTKAPTEVAKVAFIAPAEEMRSFGKLVRDTANGARDAAERLNAQLRRKGA